MKKIILQFISLFLISIHLSFAQDAKFGKISKEELLEKVYEKDSSANAAILYKNRKTYYDYSGAEGWMLITKVHQRIKLYNKDGFDWATKKISLYDGNNGEEKVSVKAYTHTLENGKIVKTKLKNDGIFDETVSDNWKSKKFTMPNLQEGCIVEWEYTIRSPYYSNIDEVIFQYKIPMKYMESSIKIPEYFKFKYLPSLYYPVNVKVEDQMRKFNFTYKEKADISEVGGTSVIQKTRNASVDLSERKYESVEQNIPALKEEPFVNNIDNYRSKIVFEFTAYTPKYDTHKYFNNTWEDVTKTIYESSNFGGQLKKSPFDDDLSNLTTGNTNEKIVTILEFVKSKIKWNGNYSKYAENGIKKAYKEGTGNVADINLTLVAMLREAGLNANPVLVSTREHGIPLFPTSQGFNYVIASIEMENHIILLDATEAYSAPNQLPLRVLNWQGRIVRNDGSSQAVNLYPAKSAITNTLAALEIAEDGMVNGQHRRSLSGIFAQNFRKENGQISDDEISNNMEKKYGIEISEIKITNKKNPYKNLLETIEFESEDLTEVIGDKIYIDPLLYLSEKTNPFKLNERNFPIDFATSLEEKISLNIQIPEGYKVESLPEKEGLGLPDNLGSFRFLCEEKSGKIQVFYTMKFNSPIIPPNYYLNVKEFYDKIIAKHSEKIVLAKM